MESLDFFHKALHTRSHDLRRGGQERLLRDQPQFALRREILRHPANFFFRPARAHDQIRQCASLRAGRNQGF